MVKGQCTRAWIPALLRRKGVLLAFALLLCMSVAVPALATTNGNGPHNENGNSTMDYCVTSDFNGAVGAAINDYNNTPDSRNMPMARQVADCANADAKIFYVPYSAIDSAGLFGHNQGTGSGDASKVDWIRIRNTVDGPNLASTLRHEMGHSYSLQHTGANVYSVMSGGSYKTDTLTPYDNADLRSLPNKYQG